MKRRKKNRYAAFTLLEMLVVLLIISILILLFVPNLSKHKENIDKKGQEALIKVVETQSDLYELEKNQKPSVEVLLHEKYITKEQYDKYIEIKK